MKKNELTKFKEIVKGINDLIFGIKKESKNKSLNEINTPSDLDMTCYELDYKFNELFKIVNTITNDSNPAFIKYQIDGFKKEYEL
jgi:hypothetical protein